MKTGILTFHDCTNYGALLQAYALWKTAGRLTDSPVDVIDYKNPRITARLQLERFLKDRSIKGLARRVLTVPFLRRKNALFEEFLHQQGMLSEHDYNKETIAQCAIAYDTVLFGSDQIWNLTLTDQDETYFGAFSSKLRKIAYAASVGGFDLAQSPETVSHWLKDFSALSTREKRDQELIRQRFGLEVEQVLDPTFLLEREEWLRLQQTCAAPERYILLYLISPVKEDFIQAKKLSKRTGLPVMYINYTYRLEPGVKNLRAVSPGQFLYLLNHAEYVVTNSFHGTALSINLKKDFYCQLPKRKEKSNVRAAEILEQFGLEGRILRDGDEITPERIDNWNPVDAQLNDARRRSMGYLREALKKQS